MASIEQQIAEWLERDGRIPDDAFEQLQHSAAVHSDDRDALERVIDRLLMERPELAARRRIALSIQTRVQARGGWVSAEEWKRLVERAHSAGWSPDDVDRVLQAAIARSKASGSAASTAKPAADAEQEGHEGPGPGAGWADTPGPRSKWIGIASATVLGLVLVAATAWLLGGGETPTSVGSPEQVVDPQRPLDRFPTGAQVSDAVEQADPIDASNERSATILAIQQELDRLGRTTEESGELDAATIAALDDLPGPMPDRTRAGLAATLDALRDLRRWPVNNGASFRDCPLCPDMVALPAGRFIMGSPDDERMRSSTEGPQREVTIGRFALARTEITYGQWLPCVNEGLCPELPVPGDGDLRQLPVSHVGATDALLYLRWLRERTGFDYRLPTEAEWEYAARAGTTTRYATGNCIGDDQANFDARLPTRDCPAGTYRGRAMEVASFPPNAFGLFDMHGNMREPVQDCWNLDYIGAPTDGSAWVRGDCGRSPLRGGSWDSTDRDLRSAARIRPGGIERSPQTGLRVAVSLPANGSKD